MRTTITAALVLSALVLVCLVIGCGQQVIAVQKQNKAMIVQLYEEGVNKHNPEAWNEVLTDDYVRHCQAMPPEAREIHGLEEFKAFLTETFAAFPDWHEEIGPMIAEGNYVAYVSMGVGTMSGPMGDIPPTNTTAECQMVIMQRFEEGKIAETWITWDNVAFMAQLGLFPPPLPEKG